MSNTDKRREIPEAPVPPGLSGNLLSSVAPPMELPNFITTATPAPQAQQSAESSVPPPQILPPQVLPHGVLPPGVLPSGALPPQMLPPGMLPPGVLPPTPSSFPTPQSLAEENEKFSPAIPLSKGQPMSPPSPSEEAKAQTSHHEFSPEVDKIGDIMPGSGLLTWMKGAVSSGGLLHKVAEKAKSSVDTMITTLDPQMKEYLKSGGDLYIVVASDKDNKVSPVREAFQNVFGKATVLGIASQSHVTASQPVGAAAAVAAAKQRVAHVRSTDAAVSEHTPVVAVEGFLTETVQDRWYDTSLLLLTQPSLGIELQVQSQCTPVPTAAVTLMKEATSDDYPHKDTGFSVTVGKVMADNLQVPHTQWHEAATGVSRREVLLLAARALAGQYQRLLQISAGQS